MRAIVLVFVFGCASADRPSRDASGGSNAVAPRKGHAFVAGGVVAKSASYKLIGTLSSAQGTSSSASYTQRAGVIGATQP